MCAISLLSLFMASTRRRFRFSMRNGRRRRRGQMPFDEGWVFDMPNGVYGAMDVCCVVQWACERTVWTKRERVSMVFYFSILIGSIKMMESICTWIERDAFMLLLFFVLFISTWIAQPIFACVCCVIDTPSGSITHTTHTHFGEIIFKLCWNVPICVECRLIFMLCCVVVRCVISSDVRCACVCARPLQNGWRFAGASHAVTTSVHSYSPWRQRPRK